MTSKVGKKDFLDTNLKSLKFRPDLSLLYGSFVVFKKLENGDCQFKYDNLS